MTSRWSAIATEPVRNGLSSVSMTSAYAELHCHSNYSFLEGASHPDELVARARDLEMPALAITDRNGFYGAVKFFGAAQRAGIQPIIGTDLTIDDGTTPPKDRVDYDRWGDRLLLLVEDKLGYTSLCRLISMAQMPNAKGMARLAPDKLAGLSNHLIALVAEPKERLPFYQEIFGRDRVFIELHDHLAPDDRSRNQRLLDLAERYDAPLVITNEVFYATPDRHKLHDVLTAIRHRTTLDEAQRYLHPNAEHYLKSGAELRQVFSRYPRQVVDEGLSHAAEIAGRCRFSFDLVSARFPGFPVPAGETPYSFLYRLCQDAVREQYRTVTSVVAARLQQELHVVNQTRRRRVLLDQLGPDAVRPVARHPGPGARLGGGQHRRLPARHHPGRSDRAQPALRTLPARGDDDDAGHRHRLL